MGLNQIIRASSTFVAFLFILTSCEQKHFHQETKDIKGVWDKKAVQTFEFHVGNATSESVNLGFVFRNNKDYAYSNLYLFTKFIDPKGHEMLDTVQYYIANPDGSWIGKGMSTKEMLLVYRENLPIKDTGIYKLQVWHGMRTEQLKGIEDISLIVDKTSENK